VSTRFTDAKGREWDLRFTTATFGLVRRELGIDLNDLLKPDKGEALGDLFKKDPEKLGGLFWLICEKQTKEKGVTEDDFAEGLDGKAIWGAFAALLDARADFCPPPMQGAIRKGLARLNTDMERAANEALDKALESTPTPTSNGSADNSAARPELTPTPKHSAS
jgi:hypothetical protein